MSNNEMPFGLCVEVLGHALRTCGAQVITAVKYSYYNQNIIHLLSMLAVLC